MRRLLTGGMKAILTIAALSTAAHWAFRLQRAEAPISRVIADVADPVITGSITPRKSGIQTVSDVDPLMGEPDVTSGLDQRGLSELFAGASLRAAPVTKAVAGR